MKTNHLIILIALLGYLVLFFFPKPQSNFIAYIATAVFFFILIIYVALRSQRSTHPRRRH